MSGDDRKLSRRELLKKGAVNTSVREVMREAFDRVGARGAAAWMAVMETIADNT